VCRPKFADPEADEGDPRMARIRANGPVYLVRVHPRFSALQTVQICARRKEFSGGRNRTLLGQYSSVKTQDRKIRGRKITDDDQG
jgi:hypothetical protein